MGDNTYTAPEGAVAVPGLAANIGDTFDARGFTAAARAPTPENLSFIVEAYLSSIRRMSRPFNLEGVVVLVNLVERTRVDVASLARWGADNPDAKRAWVDDNGTETPLTGRQYVLMQKMMDDYILTLYERATEIGKKINAVPPQITTRDQIIAVFEAPLPPR
jgi:hypothetical protein